MHCARQVKTFRGRQTLHHQLAAIFGQINEMALIYDIILYIIVCAAMFIALIPLILLYLIIRDYFRPKEKRLYPWQRFKKATARAFEIAADGFFSLF